MPISGTQESPDSLNLVWARKFTGLTSIPGNTDADVNKPHSE